MPVMNGFEAAELLRKEPAVQDAAIIFISAYDQGDAQIAKGYQVGAADYLLSPVDPDFLKLKMRTYVRMYLRIEALRTHIDRLTSLLQSIQREVNRRSDEEALRGQVRELEQVVADLRREMVPTV
jgi:CheY-like chemotaxis protein